MTEEMVDIVDENDNVLEKMSKKEAHEKNLIHKTSHVFIINSQGEILIQKRSLKKQIYPNVWTSSASGHLSSGESYEEAAHKELKEELGVDVELEKVGWIRSYQNDHKDNITIFTGKHDGPFDIDKIELETVEFVKIGKLKREIRLYKRKVSPTFELVFKEFCRIKEL